MSGLKSIKSNQVRHGGKRNGAGRKPGSATKKTRAVADAAAAAGVTPLEFMLTLMANKDADMDKRFEAAKAAAPYVHPRLSTIEAKTENDHKGEIRLTWLPPTS